MKIADLTRPLSDQDTWPLYSVSQTQSIEKQAQTTLSAHTLMQRAGLATARLAMAIAPHAEHIWIACGPGNNGGDGLEAALHLKSWGKKPIVTRLNTSATTPANAQAAIARAGAAGIQIQTEAPNEFDLVIDALLGIGASRPPDANMMQWLSMMYRNHKPILCVDVPTGLLADTGEWLGPSQPQGLNRHTLSLLTLKPGLFTASGRDAAGHVWFNNLGVDLHTSPIAWLQQAKQQQPDRAHNSHKGSYGDVAVLGGAKGMTGAAVLAGIAALHGGAGRVFLGLLDPCSPETILATHPALMARRPEDLAFNTTTVVCGCGGGDAVRAYLAHVISYAQRLVLDADALNAVAQDTSLQILLKQRKRPTVMTPHPLEAARLLNTHTKTVQENRLAAAEKLAQQFQSIVVLKGAGSIIAQPQTISLINGSGNARLATAGTGDVLAGLVGAYVAQSEDAFEATCRAVFEHGQVADAWPIAGPSLDAARLAASVR